MSEWKTSAEVAIIGGGIMGISTAYHLARRGQTGVVLLEKDLLAQASTGLCVGGIRQQFSHPSNILLSQETLRLFERFEEEFDVDIRTHRVITNCPPVLQRAIIIIPITTRFVLTGTGRVINRATPSGLITFSIVVQVVRVVGRDVPAVWLTGGHVIVRPAIPGWRAGSCLELP